MRPSEACPRSTPSEEGSERGLTAPINQELAMVLKNSPIDQSSILQNGNALGLINGNSDSTSTVSNCRIMFFIHDSPPFWKGAIYKYVHVGCVWQAGWPLSYL